jgi:hypothetical protein
MTNLTWIPDFNLTVANFMVARAIDTANIPGYRATPVIAHLTNCPVTEAQDVMQTEETVRDSDPFDDRAFHVTPCLTVDITCACGEYTKETIKAEERIQNVIWELTNQF